MTAARNVVARLLHAVSLGRITIVDDTKVLQVLQVNEAPGPDGTPGLTDEVLRVAQFGFTSNPPISSEVVLLRLWGNRTLTIAIGTSHQPSRLKNLKAGDSALYDVRGAKIWLSATGIVIDGAGLPLTIQNVGGTINAPTATINAKEFVNAKGIVLGTHTHGLSGSAGTTAPLPQ